MVVDSLISLWRDRLVDNPHQTTKYVLYVCVGTYPLRGQIGFSSIPKLGPRESYR